MKWIKVSDRLPDQEKLFYRYTDSDKWFVFNGGNFKVQIDFDGYHYKKDKVEWLDESNAADEGEEVIEFAEWIVGKWACVEGKWWNVEIDTEENHTTSQLYELFKSKK